MDLALGRPAHHYAHAGDLPAVVDVAAVDDEEIGILGNERVEVNNRAAAVPDKAVGPTGAGVQAVSHHLAAVVEAGGEGGSVARHEAEVGGWAVHALQPNCGVAGAVVRGADLAGDLAAVVNDVGEIGT